MPGVQFVPPVEEDNLIRRVLYPDLPRNVRPAPSLPPLLVELPDEPSWDEAQHRLRHLLALLFREAVLSWYIKLTPDRALLGEATKIIAHVFQRVQLTLSSEEGKHRGAVFLARDVPFILQNHYEEVRSCQKRRERTLARDARDRSAAGVEESVATTAMLFGTCNPHPALVSSLTSTGHISLGYLRLLADTALLDLLPPVDSACDVERLLVRDIVAAILRGSLSKCSRPWFFTQSLHKALDGLEASEEAERPAAPQVPLFQRALALLQMLATLLIPYVFRPFLEIFAPSNSTSAGSATGKTHGFEPSPSRPIVGHVNSRGSSEASDGPRRSHLRLRKQEASLSAPGGRRRWTVYDADNASTDDADVLSEDREGDATLDAEPVTSTEEQDLHEGPTNTPFLKSYTDLLVEVLLLRESAFGSQVATFLSLGVQLGGTRAEQLILAQASHLVTPELFTSLISAAHQAMLPDGHFQPAPPDPTLEEQISAWEQLPPRVLQKVPAPARFVLGLTPDAQLRRITQVLEPVCAPEAAGPNTHLVLGLLERALVVLLPQLENVDAERQ